MDNEAAKEKLNEFVQLVDELNALKLTKNLLSEESIDVVSYGGDNDAEIMNFDEEECMAFMLSCRLLVQDNDGISVRCIPGLIDATTMSVTNKRQIKIERSSLNFSLDAGCPFTAPGCAGATNRDVLDTFLWGQYAHRGMNPKLRTRYLEWEADTHQFKFLKQNFLLMLKILLEAATRMASQIRDHLDSQSNGQAS